jgi:hypothetical protein
MKNKLNMETLVWEELPRIENKDGSIKHVVKDGSRQHVIHWDDNGAHCSEPKCETNVSKN